MLLSAGLRPQSNVRLSHTTGQDLVCDTQFHRSALRAADSLTTESDSGSGPYLDTFYVLIYLFIFTVFLS